MIRITTALLGSEGPRDPPGGRATFAIHTSCAARPSSGTAASAWKLLGNEIDHVPVGSR